MAAQVPLRSEQTHSRQKKPRCALCGRVSPLTFHHLIPKKLHRRTFYRKHFDRSELQRGIDICRPCHSGIHKIYDEMTLGKHLNTLEALQNDERIQKHVSWVAKQRIKI